MGTCCFHFTVSKSCTFFLCFAPIGTDLRFAKQSPTDDKMSQGHNIKGVQWVIVGSIIIGLIFIVSGAILTGYAYTEITPPDYDTNYDRYIGSSVTRLLGPFILAFGGLILIASCG